MDELRCKGLDGRNPLHFLAALGALLLSDRISPGMRLSWEQRGAAWNPILSPVSDPQKLFGHLAAWLNRLGEVGSSDPFLQKRLKELQQRLKARQESLKSKKKEQGRKRGKGSASNASEPSAEEEEIRRIQEEIASLEGRRASELGYGIAHWGDLIAVNAETVRHYGKRALRDWLIAALTEKGSGTIEPFTEDPRLRICLVPALASDVIRKRGKDSGSLVEPTPLSFSNGASNQYLLKDFRNCTHHVNPERVEATLLGFNSRFVEGITGLNWDPSDYRPYAMSWSDPDGTPKNTDVAANALAYIGLSFYPVLPANRRVHLFGIRSSGRAFAWPLWESPLDPTLVQLVISSSRLELEEVSPEELSHRGISEVRQSSIINPSGKRNYFSPSRPIFTRMP
ncbi:MAG TPA: hypothetical protein PLQ97_13870 [Myxococcota bacterium]|nr:hypothetical protein [Myxococcota bacterium]HQK52306.1 hypothetical protein [Myxococcota bacterium]